jgi:hypothetical protein
MPASPTDEHVSREKPFLNRQERECAVGQGQALEAHRRISVRGASEDVRAHRTAPRSRPVVQGHSRAHLGAEH